MTPEEMKKWAFQNAKFIRLESGESIKAEFMDCRSIPSRFDREKNVMEYKLKLEDGSVKYWEQGSTAVCNQMADLKGQMIEIKREGEGTSTKYEICILED